MLKRPPRAEDDHEDSLVLLKNVGNSNFQGATLVNAIAVNGLYPLLYAKYVAIISTPSVPLFLSCLKSKTF